MDRGRGGDVLGSKRLLLWILAFHLDLGFGITSPKHLVGRGGYSFSHLMPGYHQLILDPVTWSSPRNKRKKTERRGRRR
jgi:hypothetical protein